MGGHVEPSTYVGRNCSDGLVVKLLQARFFGGLTGLAVTAGVVCGSCGGRFRLKHAGKLWIIPHPTGRSVGLRDMSARWFEVGEVKSMFARSAVAVLQWRVGRGCGAAVGI